jgi:hypothetical protein
VGAPSRGIPGNATIGGKSQARNLCLGPELEKVGEEVENYRHFQHWSQAWVEVNEQICERRSVGAVTEESELEQLKKNCEGNTAESGTRDKPAAGEGAAAGEA